MKIRKLGSNETEITKEDVVVLLSYSTPVAACTPDGFVRTNSFHSVTTSRHINKWLDGRVAKQVEQSFLDGLLG